MEKDVIGKIWLKVNKTDSCWIWTGNKDKRGYGYFWYKKTSTLSYRINPIYKFIYELLIEDVPKGLELDHLCKNKTCVNPYHLEPVTHRQNILRSNAPAAINAKKTHCIHGHELSGENLGIRTNGNRKCKSCEKSNGDRYRIRLKNNK